MKLRNGNIIDDNGQTTFVSLSAFKSEVCTSDVCFLCAKKLENDNKNKEHIIPNWILKRFELSNDAVNLPNGTKIKYGQYVIPCCIQCNSLLSAELETPLSKIFASGFKSLSAYLNKESPIKIYVWLALIFIKTHIKDNYLLMHQDRRIESPSIAEGVGHDWEVLHHVYCLSRIPYTQATVEKNCIGSFIAIPVDCIDSINNFDYIDVSFANTSGIIVGDIGIIAVFNDAGAVLNELQSSIIDKLGNPVSYIQFREIVARFACCNLHLKNRPKYLTLTHTSGNIAPQIICRLLAPQPEFYPYDHTILGSLMDMLVGELLESKVNDTNFRKKLGDGYLSILFDNQGKVIPSKSIV